MYLPIIGALLEAIGMILEKKVLKKRNMNYKNYTFYEFFAIVAVMLPILFFTWRVEWLALGFKEWSIFAFIVLTSVGANLLIFYSLKRENISEFEPVWLMQPLFTILLAFMFYANERNWQTAALALIASITLVIAHVKKYHFVFDKYILAALGGSFLFAVELVASKQLLGYFSPFSFYFLRSLGILLIVFALYRPNAKALDKKNAIMIASIGLIWALYRVIMYYGYETFGIVFTTILFILSPVFLILFAVIFLKEKPSLRQIVSMIVILACVVLAVWFGR